MHAFPATGGNVAVSHGGNGAGSIANASDGEEGASGGAGVSRPRNYLRAVVGAGGSADESGLDTRAFPPLPDGRKERRERPGASTFSLSQRKDAASEATMGLSEQRDQEGGQQAAEDPEEARERASGTPSKRSRRGVAKQQRIKELQAKIARQAWRQEQAEAQAEAESEDGQGGEGTRMEEGEGEAVFSREEALHFQAGEGVGGGDAVPVKSVLRGPAVQGGGGGAARSKDHDPPQELFQALLDEFPAANEKQAISALRQTRLPSSPGKPGWRAVHAAKLLPRAPPGAPGNPITCTSSDSSPDASVKEAAARRELALRSKEAWCEELSLSLGVEKSFVGQVFDTYRPRTFDSLECFVIGELADELDQDPATLAEAIRARQSDLGCKPARGGVSFPSSDEEADGASERTAANRAGGGNSTQAASAAAGGHGGSFTGQRGGASRENGKQAATAEPGRAGDGDLGEAAKRVPAEAAEARERSNNKGAAEPAGASDGAQGDAASNLQNGATGVRKHEGCEERGRPAGGRQPDGSASTTVCADTLKGASNGGRSEGAESEHGGAVRGCEPDNSTSGMERVGAGGKKAAELHDAGNGGHEGAAGGPEPNGGASGAERAITGNGVAGEANVNTRGTPADDAGRREPDGSKNKAERVGTGNGAAGEANVSTRGTPAGDAEGREPGGIGSGAERVGTGNGAACEAKANMQGAPAGGANEGGRPLCLNPAARDMLLKLHNGEAEMLQPLDSIEGGQATLRDMIQQLQAAAQEAHGCHLTCGVALAALEVSRHQPGAAGWPNVEAALLCLRRRERTTMEAHDTRGTVGGRAEGAAQAVTAASAPARAQASVGAKAGSGPGQTCITPQSDAKGGQEMRAEHSARDLRRKEAAKKLRKLLGAGNAVVGGGHPDASGTTGTRGSRATCGTVSHDGSKRDGCARTCSDEWLERCAHTDTNPDLRDVSSGTKAPAQASVERVARLLLADPSKVPRCELGVPNTKRREWALLNLRNALGIKMLEAERLLTASSLLHPQGRENAIAAHHLGECIRQLLEEDHSGAHVDVLLSDFSASDAYGQPSSSSDSEPDAQTLGSALAAADQTGRLQRTLKEGKFVQKEVRPDGAASRPTTCVHPLDECRHRAAHSLKGWLGGESHDAAAAAKRDSRARDSTGSDGSSSEEDERKRDLLRRREKRKADLTPPKPNEDAGATPASARYLHKENREAEIQDLDTKISEAVATALKAAMPQLPKDERQPSGSNTEETLLQNLRAQLASPDLRGIGRREALAIAAKRAARNLESEMREAHSSLQKERRRKLKRKHSGDDGGGSDDSGSDSGSNLSSSDSDHSMNRGRHNRGILFPSPAARAAAMADQPGSAVALTGSSAQTVVVLGNTRLPVWKGGSESNLQGFNWKAKQHVYHQWEQYMLAEGQHAPKEFKSLIAPELIPVICAETGLKASDWPFLQDSLVISKIDKALRPTRSTDFALQLQQITLANGKPGTLLQRYRQFVEKFLAKKAEAEAAERPVKDNVVKDAFKDALKAEGVLKMWMREVDWRGVEQAHRRLMRKLKESHSWDQLRDENERKGSKWRKDEDGERAPKQWQRKPREELRANFAASKDVKTKGGEKFLKGKRPSEQKEANSPLRGPQPGLDRRGPSWHDSTDAITCRHTPCKSKFCQRCGNHGHTAETCRMPDDTPGINLQGYFQDKKGKTAAPISKNLKHVVSMHDFGSPQVRFNVAQKKGNGKESKKSKKSKGEDSDSSSEDQ